MKRVSDEQFLECLARLRVYSAVAAELKLHIKTVCNRAKQLGVNPKPAQSGTASFKLCDILAGLHPQYPTTRLRNRLIKDGLLEYKCESCGLCEWQGKPLTLELDHIDGDNTNHRLSNLRLMCPNCHSQTETYKSKNKRNKRLKASLQ